MELRIRAADDRQRVDDVRAWIEPRQLEDLEQSAAAGTDSRDIGADGFPNGGHGKGRIKKGGDSV